MAVAGVCRAGERCGLEEPLRELAAFDSEVCGRVDGEGRADRSRPESRCNLRNRRNEIIETAHARGASRVRIFGSVARGDATEASDIDFLVDLDEDRGLFDLGGLLMDLQELPGRNVDVVTEAGLQARVSTRVLHDALDL